jgi:TPR repeat protein
MGSPGQVRDEVSVMTEIEKLREKAEKGSVVAQSVLGIRYLHGYDVERDYAEAFRWLSAASAHHAPRAMVNLGIMYEHGLGVEPNHELALDLYEYGALRGEFDGCVYLARLLASGKDIESALVWYRRVAEQRDGVVDCDADLQEADAFIKLHSGPRLIDADN